MLSAERQSGAASAFVETKNQATELLGHFWKQFV